MKKLTLLLTFCTLFYNCYSYQPYDPEKDGAIEAVASTESKKIESIRSKRGANRTDEDLTQEKKQAVKLKNDSEEKEQIATTNQPIDLENIKPKSIIKEKGYYSVEVFDKAYKIEAVKWQGDTLIAHQKGKPSKEYKFHEKDIQHLKIRKFSKGRSDALTGASYAAAAVIIYLLLK